MKQACLFNLTRAMCISEKSISRLPWLGLSFDFELNFSGGPFLEREKNSFGALSRIVPLITFAKLHNSLIVPSLLILPIELQPHQQRRRLRAARVHRAGPPVDRGGKGVSR